jgi:hypothetical protein
MELNENQKSHILSTFQYIDKLFSDIEQVLSMTRAPAFFKPYFPDIQPERQDALLEGIGEFRGLMRKILESLGIAPPQPHVGALRAILTAITFADVALEELNTKHMKGYGAVARDASIELDELVRDLQTSMARLGQLASGETAEAKFSYTPKHRADSGVTEETENRT